MSSFPTLHHKTLNATLVPKECDSHYQFRGIKYAGVPARFEQSIPIDDWKGKTLDCSEFGCELSTLIIRFCQELPCAVSFSSCLRTPSSDPIPSLPLFAKVCSA